MQENTEETRQIPRTWIVLGVLGVIALLLLMLWKNAPRSFDMDLGKIGNGTPALVFVYDPNLSVSAMQTGEMNKIRDQLSDQIQFLVADIGRPEAQQLMHRHQVGPATLVIFAGDGSLIKVERAPIEAEPLARMISAALPPS